MIPVLAGAATAVAVLLVVVGVGSTVARRRIGLAHLALAGVLEALLVVQAVVAAVRLTGGHRLPETATFLAYLLTVVLLPVAGSLWARSDPTRWSGSVLAVAGAVVAVMLARLTQLWHAGG